MGDCGRHHVTRGVSLVLAIAGIALLLTGCSTGEETSKSEWTSADITARAKQLRDGGNAFAADLLADGIVSEDDYLSAIEEFTKCMNGRGYEVTNPVLSPVNSLNYLYESSPGSTDPDVFNKDLTDCSSTYMSEVEPMYLATHKAVMAEPLRVAMQACMHSKGYDVADDVRSFDDYFPESEAIEANGPRIECLIDTMRALYPDIGSVPLS